MERRKRGRKSRSSEVEEREVFLKGNGISAKYAAITFFPNLAFATQSLLLPRQRLGKRSTTSELSRRAKRAAKGRADEDGRGT